MNSPLKNVLFIFKMIMSLVYIAIGFAFIFNEEVKNSVVSSQYAPYVGALIIAYGVFRGYSAYTAENKQKA